jgi:SAM-dependent methyltransferase
LSSDPFYKSHWKEIDEERMAASRTMFKWSDGAEQLYAPTEIRRGQRVADFGCGPGYTAVEFARRVGPEGHVHALDINLTLLRRYGRCAGMGQEGTAMAERDRLGLLQ